MIFDYKKEEVFTKSIDVKDIGNFCLRATSEEMLDYLIIVKTVMGNTSIIKFGPTLADIGTLCNGFLMTYTNSDFSEKKIFKDVNTFINDIKKHIVEIAEITVDEAMQSLPDINRTLEEM